MKNYKSTILLLIAVGIAGVVAYSLSRKPTSEELARQRKRLLADFDTASVHEMIVEQGDSRILCRREGTDGWRIAEPVDVRADKWEVEGILDKLELAEKVSAAYAPKRKKWDMADFGLDEPARVLTMRSAGPEGRTWKVLIGSEAGVADAVNVAVEGEDAVYTVKADVAARTDVTLTDLRSKKLAPRISILDMRVVSVSAAATDDAPALRIGCERTDGIWELSAPFPDLADASEVQDLANKVYDHRIGAGDFVVDDPARAADYGLDQPALTLTVEGDEETQTVVVSRMEEDGRTVYYAMHKGEPAIVKVPESLFDDLRKEPNELRERKLADIWQEDVVEITLAGPAGELVLKKEEDAWQIVGEETSAAGGATVDEVLKALKGAEISEFPADQADDLSPYGLAEGERLTVTLTDDEGGTLVEFELGGLSEDGDLFYAKRPAYPPVLALRKEAYYSQLTRGRIAFLDRLVLAEPDAEATSVFVEGSGPAFECVRVTEADDWELRAPVTGKAEQWAVRSIVGDFASLRAEAFVTEKAGDLAPYGLDRPAVKVTVTYGAEGDEEGPRRRMLLMGGETNEPAQGRFAKLDGDDRVFVLPDYVANHFEADLASKLICKASKLTGVILRQGEREVRLKYDRAEALWTDPEGGELPEATLAAVKEAHWVLRNFTGAEVIDLVQKDAVSYGFDEPFLTVDLEEEDIEGKRVLIGGETEDGNRYARGPETGFIVAARKADVDKLLAVLAEPEAESGAAEQP